MHKNDPILIKIAISSLKNRMKRLFTFYLECKSMPNLSHQQRINLKRKENLERYDDQVV